MKTTGKSDQDRGTGKPSAMCGFNSHPEKLDQRNFTGPKLRNLEKLKSSDYLRFSSLSFLTSSTPRGTGRGQNTQTGLVLLWKRKGRDLGGRKPIVIGNLLGVQSLLHQFDMVTDIWSVDCLQPEDEFLFYAAHLGTVELELEAVEVSLQTLGAAAAEYL
jgi:hypothetical protein